MQEAMWAACLALVVTLLAGKPVLNELRRRKLGDSYSGDEPEAYAAGERYFPDEHDAPTFYRPTARGLESKIGEKLAHLRELDRRANGRAGQEAATKHKKET